MEWEDTKVKPFWSRDEQQIFVVIMVVAAVAIPGLMVLLRWLLK